MFFREIAAGGPTFSYLYFMILSTFIIKINLLCFDIENSKLISSFYYSNIYSDLDKLYFKQACYYSVLIQCNTCE